MRNSTIGIVDSLNLGAERLIESTQFYVESKEDPEQESHAKYLHDRAYRLLDDANLIATVLRNLFPDSGMDFFAHMHQRAEAKIIDEDARQKAVAMLEADAEFDDAVYTPPGEVRAI